MKIINENRQGLVSEFTIICNLCLNTKQIKSEPVDDSNMDINKCAVLGTIVTGGSYSQLQEMMSYCDVPCMSGNTFQKNQSFLAPLIKSTAWSEIERAAREERRIALQKGNYY